MTLPTTAPASTSPPRWWPVVMAGALAVLGAVVWRLLGGSGIPSDPAGPWAWLPMLGFGAVCGLAGLLWGRMQATHSLREARVHEQQLQQLLQSWVWQSDAQHRLTHWRPPQQAPASDWAEQIPPQLHLWERFALDADAPGALQARLQSQAALIDVRVRRLDAGVPAPWHLQAVPRFDDDGRFAGYLGCATPLAQTEQQEFDQAALAGLLPELSQAAVLLRRQGDEWIVDALSDDASRLLKIESAQARGTAWSQALANLPEALGKACARLAPGQAADEGDWSLSLRELADGHGRLLLLRPRQQASAQELLSAAEHESFIYSVSHDLRAPIRVVDGFARILKEDYGRFLDRIGNDHLDRVLAAAARMNSMIDALLALSRLQSQPIQRKPVDLSQLASFIVDDLKREQPDRVTRIEIEPGIVVHGDPTLLRIAMDNLIGNAWKYSAQAPVTHIEFRREQHDGREVLLVADQGAGFDMRFADRLFGVFQRLHSAKDFQGTGVGLASVRRILRRHGGDIWAESEVGKGARFYFTISG